MYRGGQTLVAPATLFLTSFYENTRLNHGAFWLISFTLFASTAGFVFKRRQTKRVARKAAAAAATARMPLQIVIIERVAPPPATNPDHVTPHITSSTPDSVFDRQGPPPPYIALAIPSP